jgi:hypothetical protein
MFTTIIAAAVIGAAGLAFATRPRRSRTSRDYLDREEHRKRADLARALGGRP